jgi:hypothetical protein
MPLTRFVAEPPPDVVVGRVPVVEAGLGREAPVGVDAIEVEVDQLVDRRCSRLRLEGAPVDLAL